MNFRILVSAALLGGAQAVPAAAQVSDSVMRVHFVNVGQGAAAVLEFSCGVVLVDAGAQDAAYADSLVRYLRGLFNTRPDLSDTIQTVFISHNHVDHNRALRRVVEQFHVRRVIENGQRGTSTRDPGDAALRWLATAAPTRGVTVIDVDDDEVLQSVAGLTGPDIDPVDCGAPSTNPEIRILAADRSTNPGWPYSAFGDKNNHSVVVRVDFGQASFLFTGDLETEAWETLVEQYDNTDLLDVDVWHVGHHGSYNGTNSQVLAAINRPVIAVISMGRCDDHGTWTAWAYGHPRQDAVGQLRHAITRRRSTPRRVQVATGTRTFTPTMLRDALYGTGWDGTVVVRATATGTYRVTTDGGATLASC